MAVLFSFREIFASGATSGASTQAEQAGDSRRIHPVQAVHAHHWLYFFFLACQAKPSQASPKTELNLKKKRAERLGLF